MLRVSIVKSHCPSRSVYMFWCPLTTPPIAHRHCYKWSYWSYCFRMKLDRDCFEMKLKRDCFEMKPRFLETGPGHRHLRSRVVRGAHRHAPPRHRGPRMHRSARARAPLHLLTLRVWPRIPLGLADRLMGDHRFPFYLAYGTDYGSYQGLEHTRSEEPYRGTSLIRNSLSP